MADKTPLSPAQRFAYDVHYLTAQQSADFAAAESVGRAQAWIKENLGAEDFAEYHHLTNEQEVPSKENGLPLERNGRGGSKIANTEPANVQKLKLGYEFGTEEDKAAFVAKSAARKQKAAQMLKGKRVEQIRARAEEVLRAEFGEEAFKELVGAEVSGSIETEEKAKGKQKADN